MQQIAAAHCDDESAAIAESKRSCNRHCTAVDKAPHTKVPWIYIYFGILGGVMQLLGIFCSASSKASGHNNMALKA